MNHTWKTDKTLILCSVYLKKVIAQFIHQNKIYYNLENSMHILS